MLSVSDINDAKLRIARLVQVPLHSVLNSPSMQQHSPFVDENGVIRVGGRISRGPDSHNFKHPVILPKNCHFCSLIVRHSHTLTRHGGKGFTFNHIRQLGFFHY